MTYIYALCEPDTQAIRYIGKSINPLVRLKHHLRIARSNKSSLYLYRWITSLIKANKYPELQILEFISNDNWQKQERFWIAFGRNARWELTNLTDGGEGLTGPRSKFILEKANLASRTIEARNKRSISRKVNWINPSVTELNHLRNMLEKAHSETARKKMQHTMQEKYKQNSDFRENLTRARNASRKPEAIAKMAESVRKRWQDPQYRTKQSAAREGK